VNPTMTLTQEVALRRALLVFDWLELRTIYQDKEIQQTHDLLRKAVAQMEPEPITNKD
jgi:hypothetical protein